MEEKEFVALVDQLEDFAHRSPSAYKLRVALLAALGYVFLIGTVVVVLLLVLAVIYFGRLNFIVIKFLLIPLGLAAIVLRSLWVEFPEPEGHELQYEDAPRLFDLAKDIREASQGPTLHKILLTDDFNAGIVQRPRLGMFGWHENYLLVGLPLLRGMSPDEIRAVLAHEFGHLSGRHGAFSAWVYRVRQTWDQLLLKMREEQRFGSGIFESFFKWYAPYFAAYSYVLARTKEYEADQAAVRLSGKETTAAMLIKLELRTRSLGEEFWPEFFKRASTEAEPPKETFNEMLNALRAPLPRDKAQAWFTQALTQKHDYSDTHPALGNRLEAIGYAEVRTSQDLQPFLRSDDEFGDDYFLQSVPAEFIASKNRLWREGVAESWRERFKFVVEADKSLAALEEKAKSEELNAEDRWERARLLRGTKGPEAALPLLREILAAEPEHPGANYNFGEALLEQGDDAGIRHIELTMEKEVHVIPAGCELIYNFLIKHKRAEEAERYRRCIKDYYREMELAQAERTTVSVNDGFKYHEVAPEVVRELGAQLKTYPDLAAAYLVQKVVQHFPQEPSYVLGVIRKRAWYSSSNNAQDVRLVGQLADQVTFPGFTFVIALDEGYKPLRKVFEQIQGAEVYRAIN